MIVKYIRRPDAAATPHVSLSFRSQKRQLVRPRMRKTRDLISGARWTTVIEIGVSPRTGHDKVSTRDDTRDPVDRSSAPTHWRIDVNASRTRDCGVRSPISTLRQGGWSPCDVRVTTECTPMVRLPRTLPRAKRQSADPRRWTEVHEQGPGGPGTRRGNSVANLEG